MDEVIANGIKPYDLVWVEGKSAAWRYPSEIDEFQLYAPQVEEQPYDRFFKRDEPIQADQASKSVAANPAIPHSHDSYSAGQTEAHHSSARRVYIGFPGGMRDNTMAASAVKTQPALAARQFPVAKPIAQEEKQHTDSFHHELKETAVAPEPASRNNFAAWRLSRAVIIAGFAVLMFISFLIVNYRSERHRLDELNAVMQQLETQEEESIQDPADPEAVAPPNEAITGSGSPHNPTALPDRSRAATASTGRPVPTQNRPSPSSSNSATTNNSLTSQHTGAKQSAAASPSVLPVAPQPEHENLYELVEVKTNEYRTGLLGGISDLRLELNNHSQRELHRVFVELRYLGPEKKVVRTQTVYFENVAPGGRSVLDVPKSNRGVTVDYIVTNIKS